MNQIVKLQGTGTWGCDINIAGIYGPAIYSGTTQAAAQTSCNSSFGSGNVTVTKTGSVFYFELTGAWANTAKTYWTEEIYLGSPTFTLHQAATSGGGGSSPTELSELQAANLKLTDVTNVLTSFVTQCGRIIFLLEATAIAVCMFWGLYFVRFLILCKNQGRIW